MKTFYLTRKEMAFLLLSLQGKSSKTPLMILQDAWVESHKNELQDGKSLAAFIDTSLPSIFEKIIRMKPENVSISLHDIVSLGTQIEYTHIAITSVQNWVKRDFKELIGPPAFGRKYSIEQATILFIIEDLKSSLDFESIRKLLTLIFHDHTSPSKDLINPVDLYMGYSKIFEELDKNNDQVLDISGSEARSKKHDYLMEALIKQKADEFCNSLPNLNNDQQEAVSNTIVIAMLSVQTAYFQALAKRFLNATLFLQHLGSKKE